MSAVARHQVKASVVRIGDRKSLEDRDVTERWPDSMAEVTEANIDEDNRIIKSVCVFGRARSDNGYTYQDQAIEQLSKLVEGSNIYINHPSKSETKDRDGVRDLRDWAGIYYGARREGEKVFANLHAREEFWPLIKDIALMRPMKVGNSINSRVRVYIDKTGEESIVGVDKLYSTDIVASGATITNLFESVQDSLDEAEIKTLQEMGSLLEEYCPKIYRSIQEGILADKIRQDEINSKVSRLLWKANDVIYDTLRDKEIKKFKDRREKVIAVLDDLEAELKKIIPKVKPDEEGGAERETTTEGKGEQRLVVKIPTVIIPD